MPLMWTCKHHSELSNNELYALLQLRCEVFVVEQQCPYQDIDGQDLAGDTHHLLAFDNHQLLAYLRLLVPAQGEVAIGRVITAPAGRGQGLGHQLMQRALAEVAQRWPERPLYLAAQAHLQGYYGRYGFHPEGEPYLEDGIPHIDMRRLSS
ncbi:GNAT family N-acetyltransferase [Pseudomonas typographi]|uniref:GNAT family N-acetyltransferase n=1 Tax=Pseudomonas typographi TaxID=2715964 RepID=A0ABR7Z541_9PSED|nr:GNAT family N-acetyltransferase [Pseudomonas typographi]MBD1552813.1 GNAT family N-acetyltransferase [Pseudomonas typographi]MBD1586916.1 GNAT family N-acetyltransferase [Pseudomonas typographi]MBD1600625.1 GNAT family N-acetyltransferase [Pseudomonas typographi]